MRRLPTTALLPLFCAALSTACSGTPPRLIPEIRIERQEIPPGLLACAAAPAPPAAGATQRDVAGWAVELAAAGEDCRAKLGAVRDALGHE